MVQLTTIPHALDCRVIPVEFRGCLHLKSAVTRIGDGLLLNPDWVEASVFSGACDSRPRVCGQRRSIRRTGLRPT